MAVVNIIPQQLPQVLIKQMQIKETNLKRDIKLVRGVEYLTFLKFKSICPNWALRFEKGKVFLNWGKMTNTDSCVLGEFNGWNSNWKKCDRCLELGFGGGEDGLGFYRYFGWSWSKVIPVFVKHVEEAHPEKLKFSYNKVEDKWN